MKEALIRFYWVGNDLVLYRRVDVSSEKLFIFTGKLAAD